MSPKQKFEAEEAENQATELANQITKATKVRNALLDEVVALEKKKTGFSVEIDVLVDKRDDLTAQVEASNIKLTELDTQIIDITTEIRDYRGRITDLLAQIHDLDDTKERAVEDIDVLDTEISNLEERTLELDNQFKIRKNVLDKQIAETQTRLKTTLDSLIEAQRKDKTMRQAWAEEHFKLEKRTKVVREMEARVSDAETRIVELNNYSKLT